MSKKHVCNTGAYWIIVASIILIATGTYLACIGQNTRSKSGNNQSYQILRKKNFQIDMLKRGKSELLARIEDYQESMSEKDRIIQQLESQIGKTKTLKQAEEEQAVELQVSEIEYHDIIAEARQLCVEGKYDDAFQLADDMRQKRPDLGLAYFILGTIKMRERHYDEGEALLERAVKLVLTEEDMAWAFHNLGISSARKKDYQRAREYFGMAIAVNPNIEESKKALKLIDDLD